MILKKLIPFFIFLGLGIQTLSQKSTIKASVSKNKLAIGELIEFSVEAELYGNDKFPVIDTIPHFEWNGQPQVDSGQSGNATTIKVIYRITSFDSGHWVIPSFSVSRTIKTDTIPIDVVFSDFDPAQEYHDIKDILEVDAEKKKPVWWWYAIAGAVLLGLIIYFLRKKKPKVAAVAKPALSPYQEAMKALDSLQRDKPGSKQFYSGLTDIFRLYIFRKKGILSLQKTTDDLVVQLRSLNLEKDLSDKLGQALRLGDFVKFAKYVPSAEDDSNAFQDIVNAIKKIEESFSS